jgi:hypothetical protein
VLLRMLNDPCQCETGRQMARANPQCTRLYARSQEPGAGLTRAVKLSPALAKIILFDGRATRGNTASFRSSEWATAPRRAEVRPAAGPAPPPHSEGRLEVDQLRPRPHDDDPDHAVVDGERTSASHSTPLLVISLGCAVSRLSQLSFLSTVASHERCERPALGTLRLGR